MIDEEQILVDKSKKENIVDDSNAKAVNDDEIKESCEATVKVSAESESSDNNS